MSSRCNLSRSVTTSSAPELGTPSVSADSSEVPRSFQSRLDSVDKRSGDSSSASVTDTPRFDSARSNANSRARRTLFLVRSS